jgi:hypothetical protein
MVLSLVSPRPRRLRSQLIRFPGQGILAALDTVSAIIDFNHAVDGLSLPNVVEHSSEELPLAGRRYIRNNDDQPGVQRFFFVQPEKIGGT